jgi:hypothetical protein
VLGGSISACRAFKSVGISVLGFYFVLKL